MERRHLFRAGLLAGAVALPLAFGALAQVEAERQLDAAIARLRAGLGPDGSLEWRARRVDPVTGTARLEGVTLRHRTDRITADSVVLERPAADRVGRAELAGLRLEGAAKDPSGPVSATLGRLVLTDLLLPAGPGGTAVDWSAAAVGEAVAEGLRATRPPGGEMELGRLSLLGYAPGTLREGVAEGFRFTDRRDGEMRMSLGRFRLAGATLPRIGAEPDPWTLAADLVLVEGAELMAEKDSVLIRLGQARAENWGEGRATTASAEGLRVEGDTPDTGPFAADLGRFALAGVAARDLAYAFAHDVNPPQSRPGQEQTGTAEGLAVSVEGRPLLRVGSVALRNAWEGDKAERGTVAVEGFALDLPPESGGAWLDSLGFKSVTARMNVSALFEREAGRITTDPLSIQVPGLGNLGFSMVLGGIEVPVPGEPAPQGDDPFEAVSSWTVAGFTIRYTEDGLLRAILAQQARQEGIPEAQLRQRYATMALRTPLPGGTPGKEAPAVRRVREAWAAFARDLGTIEMAFRPAKPVPMLEFMGLSAMSPDQMVRELNVTATATPPGR